jgi:tRNA uridine 5-carboxymethylaminomethyl modification enzyme
VLGGGAVDDALAKLGSSPLGARRVSLADLYRRPELDWRAVETIAAAGGVSATDAAGAVLERIAIELAYEGYLRRQEADAARLSRADAVIVPDGLDYRAIPGLSREAIEKLEEVRPRSVGQASRISGVTPAAVAILLTYIGLHERRRADVASRT